MWLLRQRRPARRVFNSSRVSPRQISLRAVCKLSTQHSLHHHTTMPNIPNDDPGLAAASVLNFASLLIFWLRHLPPVLPVPRDGADRVYRHFYQVMSQVGYLVRLFPDSLSNSSGVVTIRVHDVSPEDQVVPDLVVPAPQPQPRPPRVLVQPHRITPEASERPAPQPFLPSRRKQSQPERRDLINFDP